jgi:hypothetical protein
MSGITSWKRTIEEEVKLRCLMVRGTFLEAAAQAVVDLLGDERAGRQVPISGATNVVRRGLSVTARLYEYCAADGINDELRLLCSDSSSKLWIDKLTGIGMGPIPSGLVQGGARGGLHDMLEYLQSLEYCGMVIDWSERSGRPFVMVAEPDDLLPTDIEYAPDDPLSPVLVRWKREREVDGRKQIVRDVWDLRNLDNPAFRVELGGEDVTHKVTALAEAYTAGQLSGKGYWWRYKGGRPFMPIVIYGHPSRVMRGIAITEAALDAIAYRTSVKSAVIDSGFPTREVVGLITGTTAEDGAPEGSAVNPGDTRVWRHTDELRPGEHWQFSATCDPEAMFRTAQAQENDALTQLGFVVDLTKLGGEPLETAMREQQRNIAKWYNICRAGDSILFRRLAAVCNRQLGKSFPESGYSTLYDRELLEALEAAKPEPNPEPTITEEPTE